MFGEEEGNVYQMPPPAPYWLSLMLATHPWYALSAFCSLVKDFVICHKMTLAKKSRSQSRRLVKNTLGRWCCLPLEPWEDRGLQPSSPGVHRTEEGRFKTPPILWCSLLPNNMCMFHPHFILRKSNRLIILLQADIRTPFFLFWWKVCRHSTERSSASNCHLFSQGVRKLLSLRC